MLSVKLSRLTFRAPLSDWLLTALFILLLPSVVLANEEEGGLYIQMEGSEASMWTQAPQLATNASMVINGLVNRVKVEQHFTNPTDDWVHARYLFPLPQNAAVDHLIIRVGERIIEGEIQKKQDARKTFNQAAIEGKKASLIEQHRTNLFSTHVANIAPNETIVVEIEYQETVHYEDGEFSLRFPTTFTQRYIPGLPENATQLEAATDERSVNQEPLAELQNGWAVATKQVSDANEITTEYRDPMLEDAIDFTLDADINMGLPIEGVHSPNASLNIDKQSESRYFVSLSDMQIANQDFVLTWRPKATAMPVAAMFVQEDRGQRYGLLMAMPPQSQHVNTLPQNITLILDVSGSMYGESMEQAKQAVVYALNTLEPSDYFNLIVFNESAEVLSPSPLQATSTNIAKVTRVVKGIEADGGTEMLPALGLAFASEPMPEHINQLVFITDGAIGNEDELYGYIQQDLGSRRLFTVGIGSAPNSALMQRAAISGKGTYTFISNITEVKSALKPLFEKLSAPIMQDIAITWQDESPVDAWPNPIPDLYQTQPLVQAFKIPEGAETLNLHGLLNQDSWEYQIDLPKNEDAKASGLNVLWARQQIESLSLNPLLSAEEKEDQITDLGLTHHIVTKHTSLVAIDKTPSRPLEQKAKAHQVRPHLPKNNGVMLQSGLGSDVLLWGGVLMMLASLVVMLLSPLRRNTNHQFDDVGV
ncbi:marine proteobacterial sortase target protein [Enterovibrio calviensis]|uniref:marine proteobacterial sortase target protein n=1 Tax=Enterovibrio calviensis TaxID=91359 RepID=UPI0004812931|nr:marine proteobacterial sortase target protein [Enterovibrio calviensis]